MRDERTPKDVCGEVSLWKASRGYRPERDDIISVYLVSNVIVHELHMKGRGHGHMILKNSIIIAREPLLMSGWEDHKIGGFQGNTAQPF